MQSNDSNNVPSKRNTITLVKKASPNFKVLIARNKFSQNLAECIHIYNSLKKSKISIICNEFKRNYIDLFCETDSCSEKIDISQNTFEVVSFANGKSIKIKKRFDNLCFDDNTFIRISEKEQGNFWARLLGCKNDVNISLNENINPMNEKNESDITFADNRRSDVSAIQNNAQLFVSQKSLFRKNLRNGSFGKR